MLFFSQVLVGVHESSAVFSLGLALILFAYITVLWTQYLDLLFDDKCDARNVRYCVTP